MFPEYNETKTVLNDYIKPEAREEYKQKFGGKLGRKILRNMAKAEIKRNKGQLQSPIGKVRPRQKRKEMAKALKIPFTPQYNGPIYKLEWKVNKKDKDGNPLPIYAKNKYEPYIKQVAQ